MKDYNSSADVEKAKAAMKAREEAAKAACRPPESTGSLIESEDSTVNIFHQKFLCALPVPYSSLSG